VSIVVDVVEQLFDLPGNTWPDDKKLKRVGQYFAADLYDGVSRSVPTNHLLYYS